MRGAYFMANDSVLDLAVAFLNSFRRSNPKLPLCLIPFDRNCKAILKLKGKYGFSVFSDSKVLKQCDRISVRMNRRKDGVYRKLAIWNGPFDEFVYFDVDTVVLEDARFAFKLLKNFDFIASHSNIPENRKLVWKESMAATRALSPKQLKFSASTGFLASKRPALPMKEMLARLPQALPLARHMSFKEQSLLNYFVVTSKLRYTSLGMIAALNPDLDIPQEKWAGTPLRGELHEGRILKRRPRILFVHWAGLWQRGWHKFSPLWRYYRGRM